MKLREDIKGRGLTSFSPNQRMLLKSRLWLYQQSHLVGTNPISLRKLASEITNLPELPNVTPRDKEIIKQRFRDYLVSPDNRTRAKITQEDIKEAAFSVSKDPLHRWYEGQPDRVTGDKEDYVPTPPILGAIRDFLVITKHLTEQELEIDDSSLFLAHALNEFMAPLSEDETAPRPGFEPFYVSYEKTDSALLEHILHVECVEEAHYLRLLRETRIFKDIDLSTFEKALAQLKTKKSFWRETRTAWVALNAAPTLLVFQDQSENLDENANILRVITSSAPDGKISMFETLNAHSYEVNEFGFVKPQAQYGKLSYISVNYEHKIDYFTEFLYNQSEFDGLFLSDNNSVEEQLNLEGFSDEDIESGKAFLKLSQHYAKNWQLDYDVIIAMVKSGAELNYRHPKFGFTSIHVWASVAAYDVLDAIYERSDVNYLVRNHNGLLPSDDGFRVCQETGQKLAEKQIEQAQREGISMEQVLSGPVAAAYDGPQTPGL